MLISDKKLGFFHHDLSDIFNPLSANPHKMIKHTKTIRRQIADEMFECV